jgi:hypothetical protein
MSLFLTDIKKTFNISLFLSKISRNYLWKLVTIFYLIFRFGEIISPNVTIGISVKAINHRANKKK